MKLHHYGLLTKDLNSSISILKKNSYVEVSNIIECKYQNVRLIFLKKKNSKILIELVDCKKNNQLKKFFKKEITMRKNKLFFKYHECYYSEHFNKMIDKFKNTYNCKSLDTENKSVIFRNVIFFKKKNSKLLIELVSNLRAKYKYLLF